MREECRRGRQPRVPRRGPPEAGGRDGSRTARLVSRLRYVAGAGVVGAEHLEHVEVPLPGVVVVLHLVEERRRARPSRRPSRRRRCRPGQGGDPRVSAVSGMRSSSSSASSVAAGRRLADEQLGQGDDGRLVARVELEHLRAATPRRRRRGARPARPPPRWAAGGRRTSAPSASGWAPMNPSTTLPSFRAYTAGMPCTWNAWPSGGSRRRRPWPAPPCPWWRRPPSRGSDPASCTGRTTRPRGRRRPAPLRALDHLGGERGIGDIDEHAGESTGGVTLAHGAPAPGRLGEQRHQGPRRRGGHRHGSRPTCPAAAPPLHVRPDRRRTLEPHLQGHRRGRRGPGCCAARRWATCSPPPTTWAGSTRSSRRWPPPTSRCAPVAGLSPDDAVNGAPFYVMDFVDGPRRSATPPRPAEAVRRGPHQRRRPPSSTPSPHPRRRPRCRRPRRPRQKEGYIARQLKRWYGQWEKSKTRELAARRRGPRRAPGQRSPTRARRHRPRRLPPRQLHDRRRRQRHRRARLGDLHAGRSRSPTSGC